MWKKYFFLVNRVFYSPCLQIYVNSWSHTVTQHARMHIKSKRMHESAKAPACLCFSHPLSPWIDNWEERSLPLFMPLLLKRARTGVAPNVCVCVLGIHANITYTNNAFAAATAAGNRLIRRAKRCCPARERHKTATPWCRPISALARLRMVMTFNRKQFEYIKWMYTIKLSCISFHTNYTTRNKNKVKN